MHVVTLVATITTVGIVGSAHGLAEVLHGTEFTMDGSPIKPLLIESSNRRFRLLYSGVFDVDITIKVAIFVFTHHHWFHFAVGGELAEDIEEKLREIAGHRLGDIEVGH